MVSVFTPMNQNRFKIGVLSFFWQKSQELFLWLIVVFPIRVPSGHCYQPISKFSGDESNTINYTSKQSPHNMRFICCLCFELSWLAFWRKRTKPKTGEQEKSKLPLSQGSEPSFFRLSYVSWYHFL